MAGTAEDHKNALWMESKFLDYGLPFVEIEESWPLLNTPVSRSLTLKSPFVFVAPLTEDIIPEDPDSRLQNDVPSFFGYGASGNVTAALVYANFGTVQDFETLKERGIDVRGKIVLVRYGSVFRGLKVRAAEMAGAAGVLVYSDPKEDGVNRGPVYPGALEIARGKELF
jgi:N-acetylated-alpha-linked acidic dipeptidase